MADTEQVVVVGGGIIGVCTAFSISQLCPRARVTLIEARSDVATETTFGNAGRFSLGSFAVGASASPATLQKMAKTVLTTLSQPFSSQSSQNQTAAGELPSSLSITPSLMWWGTWFIRNCTPQRHQLVSESQVKLGKLSSSAMGDVMQYLQLHKKQIAACAGLDEGRSVEEWIRRKPDTLFLCDTEAQMAPLTHRAKRVVELGLGNSAILTCSQCMERYPFLRTWRSFSTNSVGCVVVESDWTADARLFTRLVCAASRTSANPVHYVFNTKVEKVELDTTKSRAVGVVTGDGKRIPADKVVLCTGLRTPSLLRPLGAWLPIQPMKGHSLDFLGCTIPSNSAGAGSALFSSRAPIQPTLPDVGIADMASGPLNFQLTPLGPDSFRVVGFAEFTFDTRGDSEHEAALVRYAQQCLPGVQWKTVTPLWTGLRPMTPDGLPIVGLVQGSSNVYVNAGHGSLGWTMSAGTALLAAQCVAANANTPAVSQMNLAPQRFSLQGFLS